MEVKVKVSEKYKVLYNLPDGTRLVILMGGRGSAKTYNASLWAVFNVSIWDKKVQVLRDEKSQIQASILNEIFLRWDKVNQGGVFDSKFTKLFDGIKNNKTGEKVVFTQGFRASTVDKKANLKGASNVDIGLVEEGEDVRNEQLFNMWSDSIRNEGSMIVFICNTPDIHHFIVHRYFTPMAVTADDEPELYKHDPRLIDGYYKLVPKNIDGVQTIFTTHEDNPHLPEHVRQNYRNYGNPESHLWNPHYYLTAIKGYSTTGLSGQIFKYYELIEDDDYIGLPYEEIIGIDFGTSSPAGIVGVKLHKGDIWIRELNYQPLSLLEMGRTLCRLGLTEDTLAIADCAEPATIRDLRFGLAHLMSDQERADYPIMVNGFRNLRPSPDKRISEGIDTLLSMRIHVTKGSENLLKELTMYTWATDRDGKPTGKPVDAWNHCFIGSTMIPCQYFDKELRNVKEGDFVMTRYGLRQVLHKFNNGRKAVREYRLIFDGWETTVICTSDHKVWTDGGWTEIRKLQPDMTLCFGRSSEAEDSICTTGKSITLRGATDYMLLYGKHTMVSVRKGITFIIKMATDTITRFGTWSALMEVSTYQNTCTQEIKTSCEEKWTTQEPSPTFGTGVKQVSNGIPPLHENNGKKSNREHLIVNGVGRNTKQNIEVLQSFATKTAKLKHLEIGEERLEMVYDLMVDKDHEYFANGLLVHNCIDPIRYVVQYYGRLY